MRIGTKLGIGFGLILLMVVALSALVVTKDSLAALNIVLRSPNSPAFAGSEVPAKAITAKIASSFFMMFLLSFCGLS